MSSSNINLRRGTLAEWDASDKSDDDIVFITDVPVIKALGNTYGGSGVPTWDGESKAYADPLAIFEDIYTRLKKPLYLCDSNCPKFDIYINQNWYSYYNTKTKERTDNWSIGSAYYAYNMRYNADRTEFSHIINQTNGLKVVFTFDVLQGSSFIISKCSDDDWLYQDHSMKDPEWDNDKQTFVYGYGYDFDTTTEYSKDFVTGTLKKDNIIYFTAVKDCKVVVTYYYGETVLSPYSAKYVPKISISFEDK